MIFLFKFIAYMGFFQGRFRRFSQMRQKMKKYGRAKALEPEACRTQIRIVCPFCLDSAEFFWYNNTAQKINRGVAQLVARLLWEQDAAGSSPVTSTKKQRERLVRSLCFFVELHRVRASQIAKQFVSACARLNKQFSQTILGEAFGLFFI